MRTGDWCLADAGCEGQGAFGLQPLGPCLGTERHLLRGLSEEEHAGEGDSGIPLWNSMRHPG